MKSDIKIPSYAPISGLSLTFNSGNLLSLSMEERSSDKKVISVSNELTTDNEIENILIQLEAYFSTAMPFKSMSLAPLGTSFQQSVWNELLKIPTGETRSYGQIAKTLNTSARAVGNACRKNPIQLIIPCHRVVSANGVGGYDGKTEGNQIDIKCWLLKHEGVML